MDDQDVLARIEEVERATREAVWARDIDRFMATVPEAFTLLTPDSQSMSRAELRESILQQWSVILEFQVLETTVEQFIRLGPDRARLITFQRYQRVMQTPDGVGKNEVLTTQRHEEVWQQLPEGWRCVALRELGGEIFVDGRPYTSPA